MHVRAGCECASAAGRVGVKPNASITIMLCISNYNVNQHTQWRQQALELILCERFRLKIPARERNFSDGNTFVEECNGLFRFCFILG